MDIIRVDKGTVVLPIEEYHRLQQVEREFNIIKQNPEEYVLIQNHQHWAFSGEWKVATRDSVLSAAATTINAQISALEALRDKPVPMFNKRGKKVKDL